jgi:hypothetical protein
MTDGTVWKRPRDKWLLPRDEVHVWRARLDWPPEYVSRLEQTLSPDERERADRFYFPAAPASSRGNIWRSWQVSKRYISIDFRGFVRRHGRRHGRRQALRALEPVPARVRPAGQPGEDARKGCRCQRPARLCLRHEML